MRIASWMLVNVASICVLDRCLKGNKKKPAFLQKYRLEKSDTNAVSCVLVCGLAVGTSHHLTRGCLETQTKKHSCHSFTLFLLGFDQRELERSNAFPLTCLHTCLIHPYKTRFPHEGFSSKRIHFVLPFYFSISSSTHPERSTFDHCRHGSTVMRYRKCKCKLQHSVEYSEMADGAADLLNFLKSVFSWQFTLLRPSILYEGITHKILD